MMFLLLACVPPECLDHCDDVGPFFRTCMNDEGVLHCPDGGAVEMDCVDDVEAYVDCILDGECEDLEEARHACTRAGEAVSSCKDVQREWWRRLESAEDKDARLGECEVDDDEWDIAIQEEDCERICELLGV